MTSNMTASHATQAKNTILSITQFDELQSLPDQVHAPQEEVSVHVSLKTKKQKEKNKLLTHIMETLGERFYRYSEASRSVIEHLCFLAKEKGFSFASNEYFANKHGLSLMQVSRIVKDLKTNGIIHKVYRRNPRGNSLGKPVIIFSHHANFKSICSIIPSVFESFMNWKKEREEQKAESQRKKEQLDRRMDRELGEDPFSSTPLEIEGLLTHLDIKPEEAKSFLQILKSKMKDVEQHTGKKIENIPAYIRKMFENNARKVDKAESMKKKQAAAVPVYPNENWLDDKETEYKPKGNPHNVYAHPTSDRSDAPPRPLEDWLAM